MSSIYTERTIEGRNERTHGSITRPLLTPLSTSITTNRVWRESGADTLNQLVKILHFSRGVRGGIMTGRWCRSTNFWWTTNTMQGFWEHDECVFLHKSFCGVLYWSLFRVESLYEFWWLRRMRSCRLLEVGQACFRPSPATSRSRIRSRSANASYSFNAARLTVRCRVASCICWRPLGCLECLGQRTSCILIISLYTAVRRGFVVIFLQQIQRLCLGEEIDISCCCCAKHSSVKDSWTERLLAPPSPCVAPLSSLP